MQDTAHKLWHILKLSVGYEKESFPVPEVWDTLIETFTNTIRNHTGLGGNGDSTTFYFQDDSILRYNNDDGYIEVGIMPSLGMYNIAPEFLKIIEGIVYAD